MPNCVDPCKSEYWDIQPGSACGTGTVKYCPKYYTPGTTCADTGITQAKNCKESNDTITQPCEPATFVYNGKTYRKIGTRPSGESCCFRADGSETQGDEVWEWIPSGGKVCSDVSCGTCEQ